MLKYKLFKDENIDMAYNRIVSENGLFCIAFFGHKATKQQRQKLIRIYKSLHNQFIKRGIK